MPTIVTEVRWSDSRCLEHWVSDKDWNGTFDISSCDERHDCDHGKTSIVQLSVSLNLHCGFINTAEIDRWEDNGWKVSTLGVVGSIGLTDNFSKEDQSINLGLSYIATEKV